MKTSSFVRIMTVLVLILSVGFTLPILGQPERTEYVSGDNATGVTPFGSYSGHRERIDLNNLNLNVVIPLFTLRGRNGNDVTIFAHYNSVQREWIERERFGETVYDLEGIVAAGSEHFDIQIAPRLTYVDGFYQSGQVQMYQNRNILRQTDGTRNEFVNKDTDGDVTPAAYSSLERFRTLDGSTMEIRELVNNTRLDLYLKNGTQVRFDGSGALPAYAQYARDTNGNKITYNVTATANPQTLTDTLGRVVERRTYVEGTDSVIEIRVLEGNGNPLIYKLTLNQAQTQQRLIFPSGMTYVMDFANSGPLTQPDGVATAITDRRLTKITYPGGGYTRYTWGLTESNTKTAVTGKYVNDTLGEDAYLYTRPVGYTKVQRPTGDSTRHYFTPIILPKVKLETKVESYNSSGGLLKTVLKEWNSTFGDPRLTRETTIINDVSPNLHRKTEFTYDTNGYLKSGGARTSNSNITEMREFDWGSSGPGSQLRRKAFTYLNTTSYNVDNLHIVDRVTQEAVYPGTSSTAKARTDLYYDEYTSPWTLLDTSGAVQRDSAFGTSYTTRGNLSRKVRWLTGVDPTTRYRYDIAGNVREEQNPRLNKTLTSYSSTTQFAYPTQVTDPKGYIHSFAYDFSNTTKRGLGYRLTETDVSNGSLVTSFTYDKQGRISQVVFPDGGRVKNYYSDLNLTSQHEGAFVFVNRASVLPLRSKSYTLIASGSPPLEKAELTVFDGLGQILMTAVSNGTQMDWVRTEYDTVGRAWRTSNTATLASSIESPAVGTNFTKWTTTNYDALDRIIEIVFQDGQKITTQYPGKNIIITDQLGNPRQTTSDGLGRTVSAREPSPSTGSLTTGYYDTFYGYDALDNLTSVTQGSQSRTFIYDTLGRLTSQTIPESGVTTFGYDTNGNRVQRTDARNVTTNYNSYDVLDRLGSITYSDGTPTVSFTYDSASSTYAKGRLTGRSDGAGSETVGYDKMGRIAAHSRTLGSVTLATGYVYNLAGGIEEERYPGIYDGTHALTVYRDYDSSGRAIKTWWDNGSTAFQQMVNSYAMSYSTGGTATETTVLANGAVETVSYNTREQPWRRLVQKSSTMLMDFTYTFARPGDSKNNGNVFALNDAVIANRNQTFAYDYLNRMTSASSPLWTHTYGYDRYGNLTSRTSTGSGLGSLSLTVSATTNRITSAGYTFDSAGNLTAAPGSLTFQYDGEERLKSANNGVLGTYTYDAEDRRAKKVTSSETRYYFYDLNGNAVWEYKVGLGWETYNHYFRGRLALVNSSAAAAAPLWVCSDHLGSPRVKLNSAGTVFSRDWYFPFGAPWLPSLDGIKSHFNGKARDGETDLLDYGLRLYYPVLSRFVHVDPADDSDLSDPQRWNKYTYVRNNPVAFKDPDGAIIETVWDVANITLGVASFVSNVREGNVGAAIIDGLGVAVDTVAAVVPVVPGGAGTLIKAVRAGDKALDAIDTTADVAKTADRVAGAAGGLAGTRRGVQNESRVLESIGETKNTQKVAGREGNSIPDFLNERQVGEIKDTRSVSNTRQLRIQRDAANQSGREHVVITGTNTQVSKPLVDSGTRISRRTDIGPKPPS